MQKVLQKNVSEGPARRMADRLSAKSLEGLTWTAREAETSSSTATETPLGLMVARWWSSDVEKFQM